MTTHRNPWLANAFSAGQGERLASSSGLRKGWSASAILGYLGEDEGGMEEVRQSGVRVTSFMTSGRAYNSGRA